MRRCGLALRWLIVVGIALKAHAAPEVPFAMADPALRGRWIRGHELELRGEFAASSDVYESLLEQMPGQAHLYWRIARNHYRLAKSLALDAREQRKLHFSATRDWAQRGVEVDPGCAECYLYKFIGLSRLATNQGLLASAARVKEMAETLERAFELGPTHVDNPWNSELANLYYAAGVFYRSVPDTRMMQWTFGVRGDRERAIRYLRRANELVDTRIDYHIELGAALLCLANERDLPEMRGEGIEVLEAIPDLEDFQSTDAIDRVHAGLLIGRPSEACDYTRESWGEKDKGMEATAQ